MNMVSQLKMGHGAFTMLSSIVLWKSTDVCGRVATVVARLIMNIYSKKGVRYGDVKLTLVEPDILGSISFHKMGEKSQQRKWQ